MKHTRDDYSHIQDPNNKIPENEPVFLIRGQDLAGPDTLRSWCIFAHKNGASNDIINKVLDHSRKMEQWQREVARKTPDL